MEEEAFRKIAVDYLPSVFKTLMIPVYCYWNSSLTTDSFQHWIVSRNSDIFKKNDTLLVLLVAIQYSLPEDEI